MKGFHFCKQAACDGCECLLLAVRVLAEDQGESSILFLTPWDNMLLLAKLLAGDAFC